MNDNEILQQLKGKARTTEDGLFVPLAEVERLMLKQAVERTEDPDAPRPRTFAQATHLARKDEELTKNMPKSTPGLGQAVPASPAAA